MIDFRTQIKTLIERRGLSISKVARMADMNDQTLYNYLSGKGGMTSTYLEKIFNALGVSITIKDI